MYKSRLSSGITLIIKKMKTDSVTVEVAVKIGSNNERPGIHGISHFIEHLLFEGTKKRTSLQIANEIESLGGEFNAATSNEFTFYYVKILKKHLIKAIDVLSDIIQNPLFDKKLIEKERKIILSEAKMIHDDPRFYQWVLFQKALYKEHPAKNPVIGSVNEIKSISRKDIVDYYKAHYTSNNIIVALTGNVDKSTIKEIKTRFKIKRVSSAGNKQVDEPVQTKPSIICENRKVQQSYLILGYKTVDRKHKDSYALDVIEAILGRGMSGRMFNEIRGKRGLGYEVGVHHETNPSYGFFAAHATIDKKNIKLVKKLMLRELNGARKISPKELKEAKEYLEGEFLLRNEDTKNFSNSVCFWEISSKAEDIDNYLANIQKVTKSDVVNACKKYFTKGYTMSVVVQS